MYSIEIMLLLGLIGMTVGICLFALGGLCIRSLTRNHKISLVGGIDSKNNHRAKSTSISTLIEQIYIGSGQLMIRFSGSRFNERFDRYINLLGSVDRQFAQASNVSGGDATFAAVRALGRYYCLGASLFFVLFGATVLLRAETSDLMLFVKDLISSSLALLGLGISLFFLLPRLMMARMHSSIELIRHRLNVRFPSLIDLWVIGLESGQSPSAALLGALDQNSHPAFELLRDRLRSDIQGGLSLAESLTSIGNALSVQTLCSLAQLVWIAVTQGGPIAERLKQFAEQSRQATFLAAENDALKAPMRLLAPLVLLIFPSTFIVLLFPVFYQLTMEFGR